jgi:uncharacterized protein (TIGR04255 family)
VSKAWKNPPVYFVIAQVRFSPVLSLSTYVPKIQEDFRLGGFPDFKKFMNVAFNVKLLAEGGAGAEVPMAQNERYIFRSENAANTFSLEPNGLTFYTNTYDTFETLLDTFLTRLDTLKTVLSLSYADRVGLRYLDAVLPVQGDRLEQYLIPQVFGIQNQLKGELHHSFTETRLELQTSKVVSRVVIQNGRVGFPPDLVSLDVTLNERFTNHSGLYAVLDTDGFNETRSKIDKKTIDKTLRELHKSVDSAFHAIVSQHAVDVWK